MYSNALKNIFLVKFNSLFSTTRLPLLFWFSVVRLSACFNVFCDYFKPTPYTHRLCRRILFLLIGLFSSFKFHLRSIVARFALPFTFILLILKLFFFLLPNTLLSFKLTFIPSFYLLYTDVLDKLLSTGDLESENIHEICYPISRIC